MSQGFLSFFVYIAHVKPGMIDKAMGWAAEDSLHKAYNSHLIPHTSDV